MIDLDQVVLQRAQEQVSAATIDRRWERDSWAIAGKGPLPLVATRRTRCLAGDCPARPTKRGYCHVHYMKVRAGIALDFDVRAKRGAARRAS